MTDTMTIPKPKPGTLMVVTWDGEAWSYVGGLKRDDFTDPERAQDILAHVPDMLDAGLRELRTERGKLPSP